MQLRHKQFSHRAIGVLGLLFLSAAAAVGQASPAQVGRWDEPRPWPIVGIHAAVLPTGDVMHLSYLDQESELETVATTWNPATGLFRDVSPGFGNMFCSGQNFTPSGELFVAGGYLGIEPGECLARGVSPSYLFDPFALTWREVGDMKKPRFYPTVLALGTGAQLIIGGQGESCQYIPTMEKFDSRKKKSLKTVHGPNRVMRDYPRAFLLSSGEVAHVSPEPATSVLDRKRKIWKSVAVTGLGHARWEGAAFYVPGAEDQVMICGGYLERARLMLDNPTSTCERIDFSEDSPTWREAASMRRARGDINAVLLPDGKVLVVGGGEHHRYESPILEPELYDPETDSWQLVAPQVHGRMYHATAVLLPDGRVLSAGQDDHGLDGGSGAWGEIYNPPYLFKSGRPKIRKAPKSAAYGSTIKLKVKRARRVERVVLMGLSAVTHSTNVGQRYVPLAFERIGGTTLQTVLTGNSNLAPPGYYMLFAVSDKGVPSVAKMILLGHKAKP